MALGLGPKSTPFPRCLLGGLLAVTILFMGAMKLTDSKCDREPSEWGKSLELNGSAPVGARAKQHIVRHIAGNVRRQGPADGRRHRRSKTRPYMFAGRFADRGSKADE